MRQRETARAAAPLAAEALTMRALAREADEAAVLRLFLAAAPPATRHRFPVGIL
ncbi:hypothetical protein [Burkholderia sp. A1]|uniref:hypothetical protein n=1 Tax=Burkholderia sp. A1 TaxID=148446 RepID=UPI000B1134A2|nr:hypothetical protein [Burkholderia sp. A1]